MNKLFYIPLFLGLVSCVSLEKSLVQPTIKENVRFEYGVFYEEQAQSYDIGEEDFTISVWVRTISGTTQMIAQKGGVNGPDDPQYWLRLNDNFGGVTFLTGNGDHHSSYISSNKSLSDGRWHHILAKRIGEKMSLYVDGVLDVSEQKELKNCANPQSLKIGIQVFNFKRNPFLGDVASFRLYKTDVREKRIKALMEETRP